MAKRLPLWTLHYAEYVADRLGETVNTGWITRNHLREIAANVKADFNGRLGDEDPTEEELWEKYLTTNDTIYLAYEIFENRVNAVRKAAAIIKACDSTNGSWGMRFEEGSVAFGLSPNMAMDRLNKLEGPARLR